MASTLGIFLLLVLLFATPLRGAETTVPEPKRNPNIGYMNRNTWALPTILLLQKVYKQVFAQIHRLSRLLPS